MVVATEEIEGGPALVEGSVEVVTDDGAVHASDRFVPLLGGGLGTTRC